MSKASTAVSIGLEGSHWVRQGRAPIACQQCRIQRVRCDVVLQRGSCTNCAHYGVECQVVSGKRQTRVLGNSVTAPASEVYIGSREGVVEPPAKSTEVLKTVCPLTERPAHISEEDFVLLRNRATFELPNYELRYQMIQGYLHHVFGYLPIIGFQDLIAMAEPGRLYSNWFVFMAMAAISVYFIDRCRLGELGVESVHSASQMFFKKAEVSPPWRMPFYSTSNSGINGRPCTGSNGKGLINTALCKACYCWPSAKRSYTGRMGGHGPGQLTQVQYRWALTD